MKNQPNDIVTIEWLLPLFNQQLSQISDGWQSSADSASYELMRQRYHQIGGALIISNLPLLASLAYKLSVLSEVSSRHGLSVECRRVGQFAHSVLKRELTQYAHTGKHHVAFINTAIDKMLQVLSESGVNIDAMSASTDIMRDVERQETISDDIVNSIDIPAPVEDYSEKLTELQYQQLLLDWRQQVRELLTANTNQASVLGPLEQSSKQLFQITQDEYLQRLWYVSELWLNDLAHNDTPLPEYYVPILSELGQVIKSLAQHAEPSTSVVKRLITQIYVELSALAKHSESTQSVLGNLSKISEAPRFLPRILNELEMLVFNLDMPATLVHPLKNIYSQLEGRGWRYYASQVNSISTDVEKVLSAEADFTQEQWEIERKLQELYNAIYHTEREISRKIGGAGSFNSQLGNVVTQASGNDEKISADGDLRELRISVEEIKESFNEYIQRQDVQVLPEPAEFEKISDAFKGMSLPEIQATVNEIAHIFAQLKFHDFESLSWDLTQALAEALTSIELLLDSLAQQVFDQQLLALANEHTAKASDLLNDYIVAPEKVSDALYKPTPAATDNVLRYDDEGEVVPAGYLSSGQQRVLDDADDKDGIEPSIDNRIESNNKESEVLVQARMKVKPDDFEVASDSRDVFTEEAMEVITDLEDFLPIWQEDSQDLTPLTEVRRGFHVLKGSGSTVGAFSISAMAWSIENLLNHLLNKTLPVTEDVVNLVVETTKYLPALVDDFAASQQPSFDPTITVLRLTHEVQYQM